MKVILSGGGTGGHIYPALAVGAALRRETEGREPLELLYIGVSGRMDEIIVGHEGLPFRAIRSGALRVRSPLGFARGLANLAAGAWQSWRILGRFCPDAVFATGGYASVPVGVAAKLRRKPLIVYLPDVTPGLAVRLLSKLADVIATTTDTSHGALPKGKAVATGYPLRAGFGAIDRAEARRALGLPLSEKALLVTGASQGARSINRAAGEQLEGLLSLAHVVHLTGRGDEQWAMSVREKLPEALRERYHVFGYLHEMAQAMAAADLAVMRSGASILGELPAMRLPAILVPGVYEGWDQSPNARFLADRGAAVLLPNDQLDSLLETVRRLINDNSVLESMRQALAGLDRPDAARRIARLVTEAAA